MPVCACVDSQCGLSCVHACMGAGLSSSVSVSARMRVCLCVCLCVKSKCMVVSLSLCVSLCHLGPRVVLCICASQCVGVGEGSGDAAPGGSELSWLLSRSLGCAAEVGSRGGHN